MDTNNLVLLRGTLTRDSLERTLPSGDVVTQLELSTWVDGRRVSAPVAVHASGIRFVEGDEVVVTGHVSRRFFRAGGVTQSRTEVIAAEVLKSTRKRAVRRAIERLCAAAIAPLDP